MAISSVSSPAIGRSRSGIQHWLLPASVAVVLAALPMFLSSYLQDLVLKIVIYAIFALSLELLVGITGLISLGHAAFFGIAAYITVLAASDAPASSIVWLLPLAMLGAGAYALFVGALSLRTKGVYFIMVTLAFAQMAYFVFHDTAIGGGSDGIFLTIRPALRIGDFTLLDLEKPLHMYFFVICLPGGKLRIAGDDSAFPFRPCAGRHPRQRAAHACNRLQHLCVQAGRIRHRCDAGRPGGVPDCCKKWRCQSGAVVMA